MVNQHYKKGKLIGERRFSKAVEICDELRRTSNIRRICKVRTGPDVAESMQNMLVTLPQTRLRVTITGAGTIRSRWLPN